MRIIKKGVRPPDEVVTVCGRCGCEFAYGKEDVGYDQREDDFWVNCPCCGQAIGLEGNPFYLFKV